MRTVFITGASSGIGLALARQMAARGDRVALSARRASLLDENAAAILRAGGKAMAVPADVSDLASVRNAVAEVEHAWGPIDMAIANAGVGIPNRALEFSIEDAEQMLKTNVYGMLYLFDAVIPSMIERRAGQFAGVASLAGLRGLPNSSIYSASKAAMQTFLEASRIELAPSGIGVTTINPGFVETPMTSKNRFRMPFLMTAERAAFIILKGLDQRKSVIDFPLPTALFMRMTRLLPSSLYDRIIAPYNLRRIDPSLIKR